MPEDADSQGTRPQDRRATRQALLWSRSIGTISEPRPAPQLVSLTKGLRLVGKHQIQVEPGVCDWPDRTTLLCWHCAQPFDTPPIPKPVGFDEKLRRWRVQGCYCTWACAAAACVSTQQTSFLTSLHQQVCGSSRFIRPAPPKYLLQVFGGMMTIDEYRGCQEEYKVVPSRLITTEGLNVQTSTVRRSRATAGKMDFRDATGPNDMLRLRREKPLPSDKGRISMHTRVTR